MTDAGTIGVGPVEVRIDGEPWTPVIAIRTLVTENGYEHTEILIRRSYNGRLMWVTDYNVSEVRSARGADVP